MIGAIMRYQSRKFLTAVLPLLLFCLPSSAFALSPPWEILQAQFKATLEADPCVTVDPLKSSSAMEYELVVHESCNNEPKAQALADLLTKTYDFGGVHVAVQVSSSKCQTLIPRSISPNPIAAANTVNTALTGNRYYLQITPGNPVYVFFAEFTRCTVQYYADDLADAYGNITQVAAAAFLEVLGLQTLTHIRIGTTTSPTQGCR
jgi:hypothetical protein